MEVEAARDWGVPHSVLMGRGGEWTAEDTALALALRTLESTRCQGCGADRRRSLDAETEGRWEATSIRCHGCAALHRASVAFGKSHGDPAGLNWSIQEVTRGR